MIVRGATEEDIRAALEVADYGYHNLCFGEKPKPTTGRRLNWQLRLSTKDLNGPGCRRSAPQIRRFFRRRLIRSACWHAHRDYLYALFERVPEAGVTTSIASYQGYRDFLSHHPATANIDIGGLILPYRFAGACNCREFPHLEELIPEELAGYHLGASRPIAEGLRVVQGKEEEVG